MPITFNGTGTITGISEGGLPNGCVDRDTLATTAKGSILQVVSTKTTAHASSSSTTWTDNISLAITPTATSSEILVQLSLAVGKANNHCMLGRLLRNDVAIAGGVGDQGSHVDDVWLNIRNTEYNVAPYTVVYLDTTSLADTSAITYKVQCRTSASSGGSYSINQTVTDGNNAYSSPSMSNLTLMEIAG